MKKKPFLLKRILGERKAGVRTTIGLIGTHSGVGVTHTGILIANSLKMLGKNKIAYIEMGGKSHIKYLQRENFEEDSIEEENKSFVINKITYYKGVSDKELIYILNEPFSYFILDFGSDYKNNKNEFLRCNVKLAVSNLIEWRWKDLESFLEKNKDMKGNKEWEYFIVFGSKERMEAAKRQFRICFKNVGFEPNLFEPSKEFLSMCERTIC